ncbi:hypothetical protein DCS_05118 [Drechmeria coniospora]|uniref:Uncharacterized protein n=1 Tax=Drechmeria coniospora TaxID=98403 RepID=A0A151GLW6_DRECN|nr:hypothetical protein DCS_05118 [Drechmeria coniospora]KYK58105.1 hypothetical protein DCS_05118 [Drechmeria coniospora]ODA83056.1 hypothetical protein RJ55_01565 [Drechmeria coniospora]
MPVTELAILQLRGGHDDLEFLETLMECQELQDEWIHNNQPHNLEPNANLSSMYVEESDPPSLLITAPWDTPEAHGEWIRSGENQSCNGMLSEHIKPGCDTVLLFHMAPAGERAQMRTAFGTQPFFNLCRISVRPDERESLQQAYGDLEDSLPTDATGERRLWAGWRIEKQPCEDDELVVFWTDDIAYERVLPLMRFSDRTLRRRFKQVA